MGILCEVKGSKHTDRRCGSFVQSLLSARSEVASIDSAYEENLIYQKPKRNEDEQQGEEN